MNAPVVNFNENIHVHKIILNVHRKKRIHFKKIFVLALNRRKEINVIVLNNFAGCLFSVKIRIFEDSSNRAHNIGVGILFFAKSIQYGRNFFTHRFGQFLKCQSSALIWEINQKPGKIFFVSACDKIFHYFECFLIRRVKATFDFFDKFF